MISLLHTVNQLVQEEQILKREKEKRGENFNVLKSCMLNGMRYILILQ